MVIHASYTHLMHITWREIETYLFDELDLDKSQYDNYKSRFKYISEYFKEIPLTKENIVAYKHYLKSKYSISTVCLFLDFLRHICRKLQLTCMDEIINPVRPKVHKEVLSKEEVTHVLRLAYQIHYRYAVAMELAIRYGYRMNTIRNLKWEDVHADYVVIRNQKDNIDKPKPVDKVMIFKMNQIRRWKNGYVFGSHNGLLTPKILNETFRDILKRLNINKVMTFHDLRHTFATLMHDEGVSIRFLQELLDHKRITTTEMYTHVSIQSQRKQLKKHPLATDSATDEDVRLRFQDFNQWLSDTKYSPEYYESGSEFLLRVPKLKEISQTS